MSDTLPGIGHNEQGPDYAAQEVERLGREYPELDAIEQAIGEDAKALPLECKSDEDMDKFIAIIKRGNEHRKNLVAWHAKEKLPWWQRGIGTDNFFFRRIERFGRRNKGDKAGLVDILTARVHAWQEEKRIAEEKRLAEEAAKAARIAEDARKAEAAKAAAAEAARLAAERARKPEHIERKDQIATQLEEAASVASVQTMMAADKAEVAAAATQASPAQMVRTRVDSGMATMGQSKTAEIEDYEKLLASPDFAKKIGPHLKREWLDLAVRQWARNTNYAEDLDGVVIAGRRKTIIR